MYIMTAEGWKMLKPLCINEIWQRVAWNPNTKQHVPDDNGVLQYVGYEHEAKAAPPTYQGELPSPQCKAYIKRLEQEHRDWVDRRKAIFME